MTFTLNAMLLQPLVVALIAGIYLIFVCVTELWPHLLSALPH
jgi:hypothetical protein